MAVTPSYRFTLNRGAIVNLGCSSRKHHSITRPSGGYLKKWIRGNYLKNIGKLAGVSKKREKMKRPEKVWV